MNFAQLERAYLECVKAFQAGKREATILMGNREQIIWIGEREPHPDLFESNTPLVVLPQNGIELTK